MRYEDEIHNYVQAHCRAQLKREVIYTAENPKVCRRDTEMRISPMSA